MRMQVEVIIPQDQVCIDMLIDIIESSQGIVQRMLKTEQLFYDDESPPDVRIWCDSDIEPDNLDVYTGFILALCAYSLKRKLYHRKAYRSIQNEKAYATDLLVRLGFGGSDHRRERLELRKTLNGSTFRY